MNPARSFSRRVSPPRRTRRGIVRSVPFFLAVLCAAAVRSAAQAPIQLPKLDVPLPTLGGKQFWTDQLFFHGWRIQHNGLIGQHRLLDPNDLQHAWGDYDACRAKLDEVRRARNLPPMKGKAVVLLHGLFRSRASMGKLARHLEEKGGFAVFNMSYASTQDDVAAHAAALDRVLRGLDGIEEVHFVAHSMGNIVVRHYLHGHARADGRPADARIKRFVMLAPPNHGSLLAYAAGENVVFQALTGEAGQELGRAWAQLEEKLAVPRVEFGVIAGGRGDDKGFNPLLPGDDDGTVTVAGTRLAGARDFAVVPVMHSFIMADGQVLDYTLRFLREGRFTDEGGRRANSEQ